MILVAHRLTTLRDTDRILVFDDGRIAETGTYAELVRRGGVFAELVRSAEGHDHEPRPREAQEVGRRARAGRGVDRGDGHGRPLNSPGWDDANPTAVGPVWILWTHSAPRSFESPGQPRVAA